MKIIIIEFSILLLFYGMRRISVMIILACLLTINKTDFTVHVNVFITVNKLSNFKVYLASIKESKGISGILHYCNLVFARKLKFSESRQNH